MPIFLNYIEGYEENDGAVYNDINVLISIIL